MTNLLLGDDVTGLPITLLPSERQCHMHVIGSSGSGKSKFLESMMRSDLGHQQGFCLIDPHGSLYRDVLNFCAHRVSKRDIVLLDLSNPKNIIGFNPFRKAAGDVSTQVSSRITATLHAWGVPNADQTPTLERTLRLIYTVLIEQNLPFHFAQFLLDFNSKEIRERFIEKIDSPIIRKEWEELQKLKPSEWRSELLSAKNRLFRLLTSQTLTRFFNSCGKQLDLSDVIENGKILLVNLAASDELSAENGRVFGALLVSEFFEVARRRIASSGGTLKPYYLYLDEFQTFLSLDITAMLDQVRKYKLFTVLAHQRFGQLDENLKDAVLTNCRIKAVFGGLPIEAAKMMAQELFINQLDPLRIKVAIYQTKFWPKYSRDKVFATSQSFGHSLGRGENNASSSGSNFVHGDFFQPGDWFYGNGTVSHSTSLANSSSSVSGSHSSETDFTGDAYSEADVPIMLPVPFQELSSVQYFSTEEQLTQLTAALKEQFQRHCFIKIHDQKTQPMRVPFVEEHHTPKENLNWYEQRLFSLSGAVPADIVDAAIAKEEESLVGMQRRRKAESKKKQDGDENWSDILGRQ